MFRTRNKSKQPLHDKEKETKRPTGGWKPDPDVNNTAIHNTHTIQGSDHGRPLSPVTLRLPAAHTGRGYVPPDRSGPPPIDVRRHPVLASCGRGA